METKKVHEFDVRIAAIHMLRVNYKSLVAEARAIKLEERRAGLCYRGLLRFHRIMELREQLRITHLALCYCKGRKYRQVEKEGSKSIDARNLFNKLSKKLRGIELETVIAWFRG